MPVVVFELEQDRVEGLARGDVRCELVVAAHD
jgi:hypothetical protein